MFPTQTLSAATERRAVMCASRLYSLWPTFMVIFMNLVLQTPPFWLLRPSMVPLDVAVGQEGTGGVKLVVTADEGQGSKPRREKPNLILCATMSTIENICKNEEWMDGWMEEAARSTDRPLLSERGDEDSKATAGPKCIPHTSSAVSPERVPGGLGGREGQPKWAGQWARASRQWGLLRGPKPQPVSPRSDRGA